MSCYKIRGYLRNESLEALRNRPRSTLWELRFLETQTPFLPDWPVGFTNYFWPPEESGVGSIAGRRKHERNEIDERNPLTTFSCISFLSWFLGAVSGSRCLSEL